jgi:uncharacterized protein (TIGR02678 family)
VLSALDDRFAAEREQTARALLMRPLLTAEGDPETFTLARRHGEWLTDRFRHLLGYRLTIRGDHARLYKRPRLPYRDRPVRIRPGSVRPGPEDGWAPFGRRHYVLLALALAMLEGHHGRSQALIGGLAGEVATLGAELGLRVDFDRRDERKAFADVLELLCRLGVLRQRDGSREAFVARDEALEEALFDIEHGRLGDLKATPLALTGIEHVDELLAEDYAASEAERRLGSAIARLHDELRGLPDDTPAVRAYVQLDRARAEEQRAAAVIAAEQETMTARAAELAESRERALAHAREHRLPCPQDDAGLAAVREALASYRAAAGELIGAERLRREQRRTAGAALEHADRAARGLTAAEARGRVCREEASARVGAHEAAAAAVGASVEQLRARLASLEADATAAEQGLRDAHDQDIAAASQAAAAERDAEHAAASLADAEQDVASKHARVASVGRLGAWSLALGDDAPDDHASAGDWPLERTLAAVRGVSREALATRRGFETLLADVDREADELRHRLSASADFEVSRERVPADPELTLVQVRHGGQSHPISELDRWLEGELHARDRTIAEEDRRLFESFLVGGLADALRERVASAGTLVAGMNEALTECTTSSGMSIELEWRPREHDQDGLREAVSLLRRDVALLTDDARARLVEFLRGGIENARHSLEQGSSTEHVMAALDYREWHEFRVIQRKEGRREVLTRRRHQQGSGGEKAVALHLPLFAAAAAQFAAADPTCPRMILLDEAFAGIDERMRAQLLGLLERFDLDFVLTSHELWGCYPELSALGIYHLHREPGIPGVATAHFRWDGRRRVEVSEAA